MPTIVKGSEQFYFRGLVFQTKKELKDRIKQLLLFLAGAGARPRPLGGVKDERILDPPVLSILPTTVTRDDNAQVYSILYDLVQRHPNFSNWANKEITAFKVTRASTKKAPPILWATFRGSPDKWRDMKWRKCIHKTAPSDENKLWSAMWNAVRAQIAPCRQLVFFTADAPKITLPCERCGLNRLWIDAVAPSHATIPFLDLAQQFLTACRLAHLAGPGREKMEPCHLEWSNADNSFRFRPCDGAFKEAWTAFHALRAGLVLLCETCRVEHWVANVACRQ